LLGGFLNRETSLAAKVRIARSIERPGVIDSELEVLLVHGVRILHIS